jgi:hypothetical protein
VAATESATGEAILVICEVSWKSRTEYGFNGDDALLRPAVLLRSRGECTGVSSRASAATWARAGGFLENE